MLQQDAGDYVGAAGNGMMAAGSAALVGSGVLAMTPGAPAAPAVAVVGAALIGAGWVTDQFSDADYEAAARSLGLYRQ